MSRNYRRVLVAIDASEDAEQVLRAASALDPRVAEHLHVVTVVAPMLAGTGAMEGLSFTAGWPLKDMEAALMKDVQENVRQRAARFGIPPERVAVRYGRAATEIHAQAEALDADLIVIGAHGRQGLPRLLLGSTANAVLHAAPCDVLTVRITA